MGRGAEISPILDSPVAASPRWQCRSHGHLADTGLMSTAPAQGGARGWRTLDRRRRQVVLATLAANALVFFDQTAVVVALPALQREFHVSSVELQWTITAFLLALATFMVVAGRLGDRFGRKRLFLLGLIVFGLASATCAAAPNLAFLVVARFMQGVGAALMQPLALVAITRAVDERQRGWAIGLFSTGGTTFLVAGPLIAGVLLDLADWRWLFLVNLPVVLFALYQGRRAITPSREPQPGSLPIGRLVLLAIGLAGVVVGVSQLVVWEWSALAPIAGGAVLLVIFGRREFESSHPVIPLALLARSRPLLASLVALFAIQFAVLGTTVYLALFLQHGLDTTAIVAGLFLAMAGMFTPMLSLTFGRITDRHGSRTCMIGGLALASVGLALLALVAPAHSLLALVPGLLLFGLSRPAVFTPASVEPFAALPPERRGLSGGLVTEARQLGAVAGVAVLGVVFAAVRGTDLTQSASLADGFRAAVLAADFVTALAAISVATVMPRRRRQVGRPAGRNA